MSVEALEKSLQTARNEVEALRRSEFANTDRAIMLTRSVSRSQKRVAKGMLGAAMDVASEFQAIGSEFSDIKQEVLSHVGSASAAVDREKVQQEARDDFLQEILSVLEDSLSPECFADAQEALMEEFGAE